MLLKDAELVQEQRSGRRQRRPTVHPAGAVFHPQRRVVRGCVRVRVGRHGGVGRNRGVLGLNQRNKRTLAGQSLATVTGCQPCTFF